MEPAPKHLPSPPPSETLTPNLRAALALLLEAYDYAHELQRDLWDFAVEIDNLRAAGLTCSALRCLLCKEYVEQGLECTRPNTGKRSFRPVANLTLAAQTCFVLTAEGAALARQGDAHALELFPPVAGPKPTAEPRSIPLWDAQSRELRWEAHLIKQFKVPAPNQELILAVFEEEGWPVCIDDPLSPNPAQDCKERLHDTIKSLNRNQIQAMIHFRGNGKGSGVRWGWRD